MCWEHDGVPWTLWSHWPRQASVSPRLHDQEHQGYSFWDMNSSVLLFVFQMCWYFRFCDASASSAASCWSPRPTRRSRRLWWSRRVSLGRGSPTCTTCARGRRSARVGTRWTPMLTILTRQSFRRKPTEGVAGDYNLRLGLDLAQFNPFKIWSSPEIATLSLGWRKIFTILFYKGTSQT